MKVICIDDSLWRGVKRPHPMPVAGMIYTVVDFVKKGGELETGLAPFDGYEFAEIQSKDSRLWFLCSCFRPLDQVTDMQEPSEEELAELQEQLFEEQFQMQEL